MIKLNENEKMLLIIHKHWLIPLSRIIGTIFIGILPLFLLPFLNILFSDGLRSIIIPIFLFILSIYWLLLLLGIFLLWVEHWLDIWIVTNQRVLGIEQISLFRRHIAEFHINRMQDITVLIPNFMGRVLNFGSIDVHTAGEHHFRITNVPNPNAARRIILQSASAARSDFNLIN